MTTPREKLEQWYALKDQLKTLSEKEMSLRKEIAEGYFPNPIEGTNTVDIGGGYALKGQFKYNRKVDTPILLNLKEKFLANKIRVDALVEFKPSLVLKEYRQLTEEERTLFDGCLIITPASPTIEITAPKKEKK